MDNKEQLCSPVLDRILATLKSRSLRQKDLADHLGLSEVTLSKWKARGGTSYIRYIDEIAEYPNVDKEYLMEGDGAREMMEDLSTDEIEHLVKLCDIPVEHRKIIHEMIETIWSLTSKDEVI